MKKFVLMSTTVVLVLSCQSTNKEHSKKKAENKLTQADTLLPTPTVSCESDTFYFDKLIKECLATREGETVPGMVTCFDTASLYLDSILEQTYHSIYIKLDKLDKKKFEQSQQSWKVYREKNADFIHSAYYTWVNFSKYGHGRENTALAASWKYEITRQRLISLLDYNKEIYVNDFGSD